MSTFVKGGGGGSEKVTIDGVKVKDKLNLKSYAGENPLPVGGNGAVIPKNTILNDDLEMTAEIVPPNTELAGYKVYGGDVRQGEFLASHFSHSDTTYISKNHNDPEVTKATTNGDGTFLAVLYENYKPRLAYGVFENGIFVEHVANNEIISTPRPVMAGIGGDMYAVIETATHDKVNNNTQIALVLKIIRANSDGIVLVDKYDSIDSDGVSCYTSAASAHNETIISKLEDGKFCVVFPGDLTSAGNYSPAFPYTFTAKVEDNQLVIGNILKLSNVRMDIGYNEIACCAVDENHYTVCRNEYVEYNKTPAYLDSLECDDITVTVISTIGPAVSASYSFTGGLYDMFVMQDTVCILGVREGYGYLLTVKIDSAYALSDASYFSYSTGTTTYVAGIPSSTLLYIVALVYSGSSMYPYIYKMNMYDNTLVTIKQFTSMDKLSYPFHIPGMVQIGATTYYNYFIGYDMGVKTFDGSVFLGVAKDNCIEGDVVGVYTPLR